MQFSLNPFSIAYFISASVAAAVAVVSFRRRSVNGALTLMWVLLALAWWSGCYGIEHLSPDLAWHVFWARLSYLAIVSTPVLWLIFAIQYSQQDQAPSPRKFLWLWAIPGLTIAMLWTNQWHGLVWPAFEINLIQGIGVLAVEHGFYFWFHALYTYGTILFGAIIFVRRAIQAEDAYRSQAATMLLAVLILLAGNGLYLFNLLPFRGLDITPFAFTLSSLILAWGLFRFKLLDLMPIASEAVLRNIGDGVLVTDASGRIIFINPALENLAWLTQGTSIGRSATQVFYNWPDIFQERTQKTLTNIEVPIGNRNIFCEVNLSPLFENRVYLGCIFVIRDITERVKSENRQYLLRHNPEKENSANFVPILLTLSVPDGKIVDVNTEFLLQTGFSSAEVLERTVMQIGLIEIATRSDLTRRLRSQDHLTDETILVTTKANETQAWKLSVTKITLAGNEFHLWAAKPIKQG